MLGHEVNYCLHRTLPEQPAQPGEPVVYFMHGVNGSSKSWMDNGYAEVIEILTKEERFPAMTFVSFDTEGMSFFSDVGGPGPGRRGYETWFVTEFLPFVEKTWNLCAKRECRGIAGLSMGGGGALKTALRHPDLFRVAAANSAALMPFNIHENDFSWLAYFSRHQVGPLQGMVMLNDVRRVLPTEEIADDNDPSVLVDRMADASALPQLYFDVGGKDYFGFHEGFFRLKGVLEKKKLPFTSVFIPEGTHDVFWDRRWWLIRFVRDQFLVPAVDLGAGTVNQ